MLSHQRGAVFLLLLLVLIGGLDYYRARYSDESLILESPGQVRGTLVFLGKGFPEKGIHQFNDAPTPQSVISMTLPDAFIGARQTSASKIPLKSGEGLEVLSDPGQAVEFNRFWIPAEKRIALFIPLHPDRMSLSDWEVLPGIGPGLAKKIEENRHKNGDFSHLDSLKRVKGLGKKRIQALQKYF